MCEMEIWTYQFGDTLSWEGNVLIVTRIENEDPVEYRFPPEPEDVDCNAYLDNLVPVLPENQVFRKLVVREHENGDFEIYSPTCDMVLYESVPPESYRLADNHDLIFIYKENGMEEEFIGFEAAEMDCSEYTKHPHKKSLRHEKQNYA